MKNIKVILFQVFVAVMITLSLTMNFMLPDYTDVNLEISNEILENLKLSLSQDVFKVSIIFLMIIFLSIKVEEMINKEISIVSCKGFYIICMFIAVMWGMSRSYIIDNSLGSIIASKGQMVKTVINFVGDSCLLVLIGKILYAIINKGDIGKITSKYNDKEFSPIKIFIFLITMWIPHLILAYPASIISDAWAQINMFYGGKQFTSHHPPFHTWLIGITMELGQLFGNGNRGLFLFILIQTVVFAVILTYTICTMKKLDSPKCLIYVTIIVAVTSPYYTAYVGLITKDTLYSYLFLLFMTELVQIIYFRSKYLERKLNCFLFLISATLLILLRNNGKYVVYPILIVIFILMVKDKLLFVSCKKSIRRIVILILPIFISSIISISLTAYFDIEKGSIKEMLSLPFQQTARYIIRHSDEVTESEKQAIDDILDYEFISQNYNPKLSDLVKNTFKKDSTKEELTSYFKVWIKQFIKHPETYVNATLNQNYRLIYPVLSQYLYIDTYKDRSELVQELNIKEINVLNEIEEEIDSFYRIMFRLPIISIFSMTPIYNLILIYILVYSMYKKYFSVLLVSIPLVISNLVIIAGPLVHPRYALPIMYSIPIVLALFFYVHKKIRIKENVLN